MSDIPVCISCGEEGKAIVPLMHDQGLLSLPSRAYVETLVPVTQLVVDMYYIAFSVYHNPLDFFAWGR